MTRTFRAPGRVNLIGEHTDYSGGLVLPAAIDRYVQISGEAADGVVRLTSRAFEGTAEIAADGSSPPPASGWARYAAAVVAELAALGRPAVGFDGRIESSLPAGAGLSSSAALEVAVATALLAVADFEVEPMDLVHACQRAEHRAVGVPSGIMDQSASLLGRADHALFLDCGTLEHRLVPLPPDLALVVVDSRVERRLEESGYARRRVELEEGLKALEGRRPTDVTPEEAEELAAAAALPPVPARRLRHVVSENARVRKVVAELTRPDGADPAALRRLFADGHASLRDDFEVSIPELDLLVELAREAGALAARMTGGGFGGSIVALAERERAEEVGRLVAERYEARAGRACPVHLCVAADGAAEIT